MPRVKGADIICDFLIQEEVPYVFGICGHGNVGLLDAMWERQDQLKLVSPRHEQTAGHMADAYFRIAHRPVATLTSCGPGTCNLVMATAAAAADSSAFYAITANVPTSQFNRGPFQESYRNQAADGPSVLRPYVKRTFQATRVTMLPLALRQSYNLMLSGRPGPVNLDVPFDTPPELLRRIPSMLEEIVTAQSPVRFDRSHVASFTESAVRIETVYFVLDPEYKIYMDIQQAINLEILQRFNAEKLRFALPSRTVFHEGPNAKDLAVGPQPQAASGQ
jgi:thiamine pyrophosphate-dependent acetolactate synthase large subunit-like protein